MFTLLIAMSVFTVLCAVQVVRYGNRQISAIGLLVWVGGASLAVPVLILALSLVAMAAPSASATGVVPAGAPRVVPLTVVGGSLVTVTSSPEGATYQFFTTEHEKTSQQSLETQGRVPVSFVASDERVLIEQPMVYADNAWVPFPFRAQSTYEFRVPLDSVNR